MTSDQKEDLIDLCKYTIEQEYEDFVEQLVEYYPETGVITEEEVEELGTYTHQSEQEQELVDRIAMRKACDHVYARAYRGWRALCS